MKKKKIFIVLALCMSMALTALGGCGAMDLGRSIGRAIGAGANSADETSSGESRRRSRDDEESESDRKFSEESSEESTRQESESAGNTDSWTEDEDFQIDPEIMELIKYNIYVEFNNYLVEVLDNIYNYYEVVEFDDEFSFVSDSGYSYGYGIRYLNTDIIDDALLVADMEPSFGVLDEMTKIIAEPARTMMEVFNDIDDAEYTYAENQYQKPKEFHRIIQKNVEEFYEMAHEYIDELDELADERIKEEEAQMLEDGRMIIYSASHAITIVDEILDECYDQEITDLNLNELDLTEIRVLYDELVETVAMYDAAVTDNNQLMKESLSPAPFDGLLNSLVQATEWMIDRVESGIPYTEEDRAPLGSIAHVQEVLGRCIDRYNSVFGG